jgi:V8-like Glu-specific endopeptidase
LLAAFCAAAGCASPSSTTEPQAVSTKTSSLLDGVPTDAEPEVGELLLGGFSCTATLVSPEVAVTAAHCVEYKSDAIDGSVFSAFVIAKGLDGASHQYRVDRTKSYYDPPPDPLPAGFDVQSYVAHLQTDVALVHLTEHVPSSVAVPASLATSDPSVGEVVDIFGYGCNDRAQTQVAQKKQMLEYAFVGPYDHTNRSCPGDSGGPTMRSDKSIFQVTSGYFTTPPQPSAYAAGDDLYGKIAPQVSGLNAQIAAWATVTDPCAGSPPGGQLWAPAVYQGADICLATVYYCNATNAPIQWAAPAPGYDQSGSDGCRFNGPSDAAHPMAWQENFCKPCNGDCTSACPPGGTFQPSK